MSFLFSCDTKRLSITHLFTEVKPFSGFFHIKVILCFGAFTLANLLDHHYGVGADHVLLCVSGAGLPMPIAELTHDDLPYDIIRVIGVEFPPVVVLRK